MKRAESARRQTEALLGVPQGAQYVLVITEKNEQKYRMLNEVAKTDEIQLTTAGVPITMMRRPGRPKKVKSKPRPVNNFVADVVKRKVSSLESDPILGAMKKNPEDAGVLHQVVMALGEEAASLVFERLEAEREGKETSNISIRRVNTLKALADTWLKRKEQVGARSFDLASPAFKAVMQYILETFRGTLEESGVRQEMIETVFARLAKAIRDEEWELEAKNRIKHVV